MERTTQQRRNERAKKDFVPHTRSSHVTTVENANYIPPARTSEIIKPSPTATSHSNGKSKTGAHNKPQANGNNTTQIPPSFQEKGSSRTKYALSEKTVSKNTHVVQEKSNTLSPHAKQNKHSPHVKSNTTSSRDRANIPSAREKTGGPNIREHVNIPNSYDNTSNRYADNSQDKTKYAIGPDHKYAAHSSGMQSTSTGKTQRSEPTKEHNHVVETQKKSGKIPIRRSASIDVGELTRKKKGKRSKKKGKVDKETLIAHAKSELLKSDGSGLNTRSDSLGQRPNSLKLSQSNSSQNVFPTPIPQKRLTRSSKSDLENHTANSHWSNVQPEPSIAINDKSAILPSKRPIPSIAINMYDDEDDDIYEHDFPTGEGYRKHGRKLNFPSSPYFRLKPAVIKRMSVRILGLVLYSILAFMVFCPFVVVILVTLPVCFMIKSGLKCCTICCCRLNQGEECTCCVCGQRLSLTEQFWVQNEIRENNIVQSLIIVEYGLSVAQIVNLVNTRIVLVTDDKGKKLYPRFSQKIIRTCMNYIWKEDTDFFIHNHVFSMPKGLESLEDLQDYISDHASSGITFERPLWELHVLTDFGDLRDTVLLFRMHPCLSDGVSMVRLLYKSFADIDSVTTVPPYLGRESCLDRLKSLFYGPLFFLNKYTFSKNDFNLLHGKHVHLSRRKVITWSESFSLSKATRIKQVTRSTLGEVLMSVAAGSIRNYFIINGITHPYDVQTNIPVYHSTTTCPSGITNNLVMVKVTLPTNTEGVVPRLWQMKECMYRVRESSVFSLTKRIFQISHGLLADTCWSTLFSCFLRKCSCIVSSLPGPEINLRLSSKQVKTIFYWFPPMHQVALAISFFTYGDQLQMAVSADRSVLPNPELIAKDFVYQMQSLYDLLAQRRIPGEHVSRKVDLALLNNEVRPEETAEQLQRKMVAVHQQIQNLKHKVDGTKFGDAEVNLKIMKKIEGLKEQFRELLVEVRQRKAAEAELAIAISEEDSAEDEDEFDLPRRPFRRRAMSVSSRISTTSVSSTMRPLAASNITPAVTPDYSPDSPLLSHLDRKIPSQGHRGDSRSPTMRPFSSLRTNRRQAMQQFEILEYQYSPSMERRYKPKH